jgi:hypothetical protein
MQLLSQLKHIVELHHPLKIEKPDANVTRNVYHISSSSILLS